MPATSEMVQVADSVVELLNDAVAADEFSESFAAVRMWLPKFGRDELETLQVVVVPTDVEVEPVDRLADEHAVTVQIGLLRRVGLQDNAQADALSGLLAEIVKYLGRRDAGGAEFVSAGYLAAWSSEALDQKNLFQGVIEAVYRLHVEATE